MSATPVPSGTVRTSPPDEPTVPRDVPGVTDARFVTEGHDGRVMPGAASAPRRPTGRQARLTAALLVATILVVAVTVAQQRWDAAAERDLAASLADLDGAARHLRSARYAGRDALAASAGRVADDAVRHDLSELLVDLPRTEVESNAPRADRTALARELAPAMTERARLLTVATATVLRAQAEWELAEATARYSDANSALDGALQEASATLASSEGRVLDDAPRLALAAAADAAGGLRGLPVPADVVALGAGVTQAGAHVRALADARAAVAAAEAAWQAEQDRLAMAAATRRQQATPAAGKGAAGRGAATAASGTAAGSSGSAGTSGASGSAAPSTPWAWGDPLPPGWTVVVETEGGGWCGDEFGNVWDC